MEQRLDILLVAKNLVSSRAKAKDIIKNGQVFIDNNICYKPAQIFNDDVDIIIKGETLKYVGRGGLKLEKAIDEFDINLKDKICADIGASTGGFTDCMLQNGAKEVFAVDVGHDQLAQKLKSDKRVANLEGINVRYITENEISSKLDFISIDVSFISLKLIILNLVEFLNNQGEIVALIKPQFEAGKSQVGKKGIVKSQNAHITVLKDLILFFEENDFQIGGLTFSPIKGSNGNIEYLICLKNVKEKNNDFLSSFDVKKFVQDTFNLLKV